MDSFQDESFEEESNDHYGVRDGTFFIIDATTPMFQNKTQDGIPYFLHCIQEYINVLKQKLMWNRQDWMGLALLGTDKSDPETKNVLTIQKVGLITVDQLKEAIEIYESKWETYRDSASKKSYPLHDALWMAARALTDVKVAMPIRRIVFLTCQDVPPVIAENEKHAIRNKVKSFSNLGLQLSVVGLGNKWNPDRFYKDLEILSGKSETEDYKTTTIEDLMNQVKKPSRVMAKLPWRLGNGVALDVSIRSLCVKVSYLKKIRMSQDTNVPLETHTHYRKVEQSSNEDEKESVVLPTDIKKIQTHGGRNICFTKEEVQSLCHFREPGLDLIGFKPIAYDPLYHMEAPKFLTCAKSSRKDNPLLFGALLNKCDARNLMAVCTLTIRNHSPTNLFCLIPCVRNGGFYLYKLAFKENVRNMNDRLKQYIYNNNDNKPPTTEPAIELATKLVKNLTVHYDPNEFPNPKLQVQQQNIETLALNLEHRDPPVDKTLPDSEAIQTNVGETIQQFIEILQSDDGDNVQPPSKRFKGAPPKSKLSNETMSEKVQAKEVEKCTAQQLKEFLSSVGLKTNGPKAHLVQRVYEHFASKA